MPHHEEPASVPASVINQVAAMRRCIVAEDGKGVGNNALWMEITRGSFRVHEPGWATFRTEDGREWRVRVEEVL
jgi:hypothetical protein